MNTSDQLNIPIPPVAVSKPVDLPDSYILGCDSFGSAVRVGISQSRNIFTQNQLADCMNIQHSHFSDMLNPKKRKYFDPERIAELESFLGNNAASQYFHLQSHKKLYKFKRQALSVEEKAALFDQFVKSQA